MRPLNLAFFAAIVIMLLCIYSIGNQAHGKNTESNCVIQKIYTPDGETLLETKMVCRDGHIGPTYWELFAEFYYAGVSDQEYCRYVKGENIFKLPKKVCLNEDGTWRYP